MKEMSKISIIMPAYQSEKTIEKAVCSVLEQTYQNIELIVIENGPKDRTEQICKRIDTKQKIIYIYEENANVSNARTIGINYATGKYIAFIDADDEYEKNFIEKMLETMKSTNSQLVTCGYKTVNKKTIGRIDDYQMIENTEDIQQYLEKVKDNYLFNELWNKLYITSIIKENNIKFDSNFELGEDLIFNLDYLNYVQRASYINEPLYIYTDSDCGLNLKYRKDKFQIEYNLTKYLESFYQENGFSMEYIYNRFARVYYNGILNIFQKNNPSSQQEKEKQLEEFIKTEQYHQDLNFLKEKVTDKKFKIAINYFFLKGKFAIKLFLFLNQLIKG